MCSFETTLNKAISTCEGDFRYSTEFKGYIFLLQKTFQDILNILI